MDIEKYIIIIDDTKLEVPTTYIDKLKTIKDMIDDTGCQTINLEVPTFINKRALMELIERIIAGIEDDNPTDPDDVSMYDMCGKIKRIIDIDTENNCFKIIDDYDLEPDECVENDYLEMLIDTEVCKDYLGIPVDEEKILQLYVESENLEKLISLYQKYKMPIINELIHAGFYFTDNFYEKYPKLRKRKFLASFGFGNNCITICDQYNGSYQKFRTNTGSFFSNFREHIWYFKFDYKNRERFFNPKGLTLIDIPKIKNHQHVITCDWNTMIVLTSKNKLGKVDIKNLKKIGKAHSYENILDIFYCLKHPKKQNYPYKTTLSAHGKYFLAFNCVAIYMWEVNKLDAEPMIIKTDVDKKFIDNYTPHYDYENEIFSNGVPTRGDKSPLVLFEEENMIYFMINDDVLFRCCIKTLKTWISYRPNDEDEKKLKDFAELKSTIADKFCKLGSIMIEIYEKGYTKK